MRVLIDCESSGTVRNAFRSLGHDAFSCDLLPSEDGSPCHIQGDAIPVIREGLDGEPWDLVICHPPCTHLASSGARWFAAKRADGRQQQGVALFMAFHQACEDVGCAWAIENPIGIMSNLFRKPDQIIQPWMFGHGETKATCLWLNRLPKLVPTQVVDGRDPRIHRMSPGPNRWRERSRTYSGIASAMASQWGAI